jgi:hypothetical protein
MGNKLIDSQVIPPKSTIEIINAVLKNRVKQKTKKAAFL